jgi:hypothetical protein
MDVQFLVALRNGAMTFSIMTFSIMTFSIMTFNKMALSIKSLLVTFSNNEIQHNKTLPKCWVSHFIYCYAERNYVECRYAECCGALKNKFYIINLTAWLIDWWSLPSYMQKINYFGERPKNNWLDISSICFAN